MPLTLGSRATFTLGLFGGHAGRALRAGDVVPLPAQEPAEAVALPEALIPPLGSPWEIAVLLGPQAAPDFFTAEDIETFFAADWKVHYNSSRTGVRLIGPKPTRRFCINWLVSAAHTSNSSSLCSVNSGVVL